MTSTMNNEQQEMTWQPIETAPKDCEILVIDATSQCPTASVGIWEFDEAGDYDSWLCGYDMDGDGLWLPGATHWMPLPKRDPLMDALTSTAPERIYNIQAAVGARRWDENEWPGGGSVLYIRADLAGSWKPIEDMPEELKDGRDLFLIVQGRPLVGFWGQCYYEGSETGWVSNAEMHENPSDAYYILSPTHYFDSGTVALPTAPQAEAEEGE